MKEKFDDKNIDLLFSDKFSGEEITPREIVWTRVCQQLDEKDRRPLAWIWWLSGLILVCGIALFLFFGTNEEKKSAFDEVSNSKENNKNKTNQINQTKVIAETKPDENKKDTQTALNGTEDNADYQYEKSGNENYNSGSKPTSAGQTSSLNQKQNQETNFQSSGISSSSDHSQGNKFHPGNTDHTKNSFTQKIANSSPVKNTRIKSDSASNSIVKNPETQNPQLNSAIKNSQTTNPDPENLSVVTQKNNPETKDKTDSVFNQQNISVAATDFHPKFIPTKSLYYPRVELDSAKLFADTLQKIQQIFDPVSTAFIFPKYFAGLHGALDEEKILYSEINDNNFTKTDVAVYDESKLKSALQQSYSFGARFGWFLNKRISLTGGAYYSILQSSGNEGTFRYNHNNSYTFVMHSPMSSVECQSSQFNFYDCYHTNFDTFYVAVESQERYDYVNFQLGLSFYGVRTKHFGLYADLLSNSAILTKQQLDLTVPFSGKTFSYTGNQLSGMNKFVIGGQTGLGFEYLPFGNLGLWLEPSFNFSGSLNRKNAVNLKAGGMRYLFGLTWHF